MSAAAIWSGGEPHRVLAYCLVFLAAPARASDASLEDGARAATGDRRRPGDRALAGEGP